MHQAVERSRQLLHSGLGCAEIILMAVAEYKGIESELIPRMATGLCGGMSWTGSRCGALTGGVMALGMLFGRDSGDEKNAKEKTYALVAEFVGEFEGKLSSTLCRELIGCDLGTEEGRRTFEEQNLIEKCYRIIENATEYLVGIIDRESGSGREWR